MAAGTLPSEAAEVAQRRPWLVLWHAVAEGCSRVWHCVMSRETTAKTTHTGWVGGWPSWWCVQSTLGGGMGCSCSWEAGARKVSQKGHLNPNEARRGGRPRACGLLPGRGVTVGTGWGLSARLVSPTLNPPGSLWDSSLGLPSSGNPHLWAAPLPGIGDGVTISSLPLCPSSPLTKPGALGDQRMMLPPPRVPVLSSSQGHRP